MKKLFLQFLVSLLVILGGHSISHANLSDGLVAYYPFDGNANDESGSGNNGTVYGATLTADRFGNPDSAYYFNGVDNFIGSPPVNLQTGDSFTVSLWINYELQTNRTWAMYFNTDGGSTGFHILLNTDQWGFHNTQIGLFNGTQNHFDISAYQGQWFHMTTEYDASRCLLASYVNGVMVDSQSICSFPFSSTGMYIGQPNPGWSGDSYYKGMLDEIRIYNRALSDAEIQELYNLNPALSFGNPTTVPKNQFCDYASKNCAVKGNYHTGIDYSGNGTAVAVAYGTVVHLENMSSSDHGMGNNVILSHTLADGSTIFSTYSHLASIDPGITQNGSVGKGQTIGVIGCSGYNDPYYWCRNTKKQIVYSPHLHFEMKINQVTGNPSGVGRQNSTCKANASNAGVNTCWGYVGSKLLPDAYGYINPNLYLP